MDEKIEEIKKAYCLFRDGDGIMKHGRYPVDDVNSLLIYIKNLENEKLYWNCSTHGQLKNAWGCPECTKELRDKVKELREESNGYKNGQIQLQGMVDDLMGVNAKWAERVKELELRIMAEEFLKNTFIEKLEKAESRINRLEERISLLKEGDTILESTYKLRERIKKLEEAVDRHRESPKFTVTGEHGGESCRIGNWKADDELYKVRDEV